MEKKIVSVVGDGEIKKGGKKYKLALELGEKLIDTGDYRILTGGKGGIMEAVFKGAKRSSNYQDGDTIAISPDYNLESANDFSDIIIPTGLRNYRNFIVANSKAVIAIGGGAGTLSEMAMAWKLKRLVIAYRVKGWSGKLADTRIDERIRYEDEADKVFGVENADEVLEILEKYWVSSYEVSTHKE